MSRLCKEENTANKKFTIDRNFITPD